MTVLSFLAVNKDMKSEIKIFRQPLLLHVKIF